MAVRSPPCRCPGAPPARRQPHRPGLPPRPGQGGADRHDSGACARGVRIILDQARPACGSGFPAHPTGRSTPPLAPDDTAPRPLFASEAPAPPALLVLTSTNRWVRHTHRPGRSALGTWSRNSARPSAVPTAPNFIPIRKGSVGRLERAEVDRPPRGKGQRLARDRAAAEVDKLLHECAVCGSRRRRG